MRRWVRLCAAVAIITSLVIPLSHPKYASAPLSSSPLFAVLKLFCCGVCEQLLRTFRLGANQVLSALVTFLYPGIRFGMMLVTDYPLLLLSSSLSALCTSLNANELW